MDVHAPSEFCEKFQWYNVFGLVLDVEILVIGWVFLIVLVSRFPSLNKGYSLVDNEIRYMLGLTYLSNSLLNV